MRSSITALVILLVLTVSTSSHGLPSRTDSLFPTDEFPRLSESVKFFKKLKKAFKKAKTKVKRTVKKVKRVVKRTVNKVKGKVKRKVKKVKRKVKRAVKKVKKGVKRAAGAVVYKITKALIPKRKLESPLTISQIHNSRLRYVALGDSYAAGVGAGGGALPLHQYDYDRCCARNRNAYPSILRRQIGASSFHFRACMGALALHGGNSVARQMRGAPRSAQLVTVTVGGNDMGFGDIITACITSAVLPKRCRKAIAKGRARARTVVPRDVKMLEEMLKRRFPRAIIVFTGYPRPYALRRRKLICHNKKIRVALNSLVDILNANIRASVHNFAPVSFRSRELCSKRPWINDKLHPAVRVPSKCSRSRKLYKDRIGGFYHPTAGGALRYSNSILKWLSTNHWNRLS